MCPFGHVVLDSIENGCTLRYLDLALIASRMPRRKPTRRETRACAWPSVGVLRSGARRRRTA
jgi:hypothetical protein